ncbi:MAG: family oxidoreductase [Bacteroidetes bacterium]|jgi:NAD(P)-dependent dehydrogenase (short-subunit alcohol dehydrogenase family)|nr:family oxidoreductase [Bacteroidota bacterium]
MIVITGITGGIGNYLFNALLEKGEKVIGTYHLAKPAGKQYSDCYALDISDNKQVESFIKNIGSQLKEITLINCAGMSYNSFAHKSDAEEWAKVINVNLTGTFYLIRAILPHMREQQFGRIINLSSIVAKTGVIGTSAYAASKAGLNGMIKSIALENAQRSITINNINLGYFKVGMINTVPKEMQEKIKSKIACNEFGDPEHLLKTIQYIRETSYLTGAYIDLNGGLV